VVNVGDVANGELAGFAPAQALHGLHVMRAFGQQIA
jgi:hypothetical protein